VPEIFVIILAGVIGLCFGSFANVVIYRVPKKLSIVKPASACPSCGKTLGALDLIPVFSWLFLGRKCRNCKKKISARYPLVELLCGGLFAAMAVWSPTLSVVPLAVFTFSLLTIAFIDADTQEIPDGLVILGAVAGVAWVAGGHFFPDYLPYSRAWDNALLGVVAGGLPLFVIDRITLLVLGKDGFGYGDVKLMAMVGLFLGWQLMLIAFLFAFISGAIFAVYLIITGKAKRGTYMAFGPFLVIGNFAALWFGQGVLDWYLDLLRPLY
jgi:leader peptidase (prepilin peptidase)/N-methyltransferase